MNGGELWVAARSVARTARRLVPRAARSATNHCSSSARIDDAILGYGAVVVETLRSGAHLGVVTDLFVEDEARAVGVGEAMVDALVAYCRARECVGIDARALPGHRATKNFFEAHGFTARALVMHHRLDRRRLE